MEISGIWLGGQHDSARPDGASKEAKVPLESFTLEGSAGKDFRYILRHVEKKGYQFEIISQETVTDLMPELRKISNAWMKMKSGKEKRFSVGFFDEKYLSNFPIAVLSSWRLKKV